MMTQTTQTESEWNINIPVTNKTNMLAIWKYFLKRKYKVMWLYWWTFAHINEEKVVVS